MSKRHAAQASQRSLFARIEEIVLASSGADAFELVFSLVAARMAGGRGGRGKILRGLASAAKRWPGLDVSPALDVPDDVLASVEGLLDRASLDADAEALDAVFEQLVTRVGKGDKGQFFTPRHVVDWTVRTLQLARGETVLDPACGSGAFLVHARAAAPRVVTWGYDVDARAVRVARLLSIATGDDPERVARADSLRREAERPGPREVDVIVTNPPFAGDVHYPGYAVARAGRRAERDALFVERCVELLRPGGRLAIVLPHNKAAASAWSGLRRWLVEQARVLAVVSLPRETFLPHTSQKAVVVFAKRRARAVPFTRVDRAERTFFARSDRAGKDAAGEPIARSGAGAEPTWRTLDHDLDTITAPLAAFLHAEGFASGADHGAEHGRAVASTSVVRALGELGDALTLAPERYCAPASVDVDGELLSSLVVERKERVVGDALATAVVFDTTHAKDGVLDARAALRGEPPSSAKKRVQPGDLLVSRLRPYLRQIALVHPAVRVECEGRAMACSTEFYVLSPRTRGESLAFLVGWLLGEDTQAHLAAAQEGGHHPRVPREVLLAMRVPRGRVLAREQASAKVERALAKAYSAGRELDEALR